MKIANLFVLFCFLNASFSFNYFFNFITYNKKLPKVICNVVNDVTNSKSDTQDILIGNLGRESWTSTINEVIQCLNDGTTVVVSNFKQLINEKLLRKASLVILTFDGFNRDLIRWIATNHHFSTVWHHMAKIIIIVPPRTAFGSRSLILNTFKNLGFFDVAVVHETTDNKIQSEFYFNLLLDNMAVHFDPEKSAHMFYDKLNNMHGFVYAVPFYEQPPVIEFYPKLRNSYMIYFLDALKKVQNSNYRLFYLKKISDQRMAFIRRQMHLTLNYGINNDAQEPRLMTYEQIGYCAMIPIPPKPSYFQIIFVEPFDGLTWMFLALTVVSCVAVFWLFRGRGAVDSSWLIGYGMFVYFVRQGVDFSRRNRMVLTILLQLIIVMIFVLSNAYEGVITSFMIQPMQENRLKTVDDFIKSDYVFITSPEFARKVQDDVRFTAIKSRMNFSFDSIRFTEAKESQYAIVRLCDILEVNYHWIYEDGERISDSYYMLPEKLITFYIELDASFANPYLQRFQYYMDLCFQAGLPQIWKVYADKDNLDIQPTIERETLELKDLAIIFYIFIAGCGLSSVVLIIEIFYSDFLGNLNNQKVFRSLCNYFKMPFCWKKKERLNVRRIFVHPKDTVI